MCVESGPNGTCIVGLVRNLALSPENLPILRESHTVEKVWNVTMRATQELYAHGHGVLVRALNIIHRIDGLLCLFLFHGSSCYHGYRMGCTWQNSWKSVSLPSGP